ncbi:cell division protein ZipA [Shewanella sp. UCD-KL12]|uniref:cell division protein ZipA n=1 Tax=Shewanella sp. UCD-KL12 TaxID=1917163 RepID=UPI000970AF74|nr:cell division protein ZipA [Shewanella sp. UCD-KL12]
MENLQLVLFVLGAIAIIAVLVHGFWSIRKQQPKSIKDSPMSGFYKDQAANRDSQGFDADGIGEVRVRKNDQTEATQESVSDPLMKSEPQFVMNDVDEKSDRTDFDAEPEIDFSLSNQPSQKATRQRHEPMIDQQSQHVDDQMELGLAQDLAQESAPTQNSLFDAPVEPAVVTTPTYEQPVTQPKPQAPQVTNLDTSADTVTQAQPEIKAAPAEQAVEELPEPSDVLVLHVVATDGEVLNGAELLPCLLSLNFKFGDMSIFHRHEDNAGTGKVLFSLANMVKPGVFNPDEMEQFSTEGVVLFMTLPCHGDPLMNFSIMLNSAHQLADDLGGQVLDGGRDAWSDATKQSYLQRIRTQQV